MRSSRAPVEVDPGQFDDQNVRDVWFWGVYATVPCPSLSGMQLDLYYRGLSNPHAVFNQGTGREEAHTVGTRFFGTLGHWDVNDEAIYQFGQFGSGAVNAWSVAIDHGFTLEKLWSQPRLGLRATIASGDSSASDADLQTFNPLFVRGNYFSEAGFLSPQNFIDLFQSLRIKPGPTNGRVGARHSLARKSWRRNLSTWRFSYFSRESKFCPFRRERVSFGHCLGKSTGILAFPAPISFLRRAIYPPEQRGRR